MEYLKIVGELFQPSWWMPAGILMMVIVFAVGVKQSTIVKGEIWERYPEDAISLASYVAAFVFGVVMFYDAGWKIVRLLYKNVPSEVELGGKAHLILSWESLPILVLIILVSAVILYAVGLLGSSVGLAMAEAEIEDRIERREDRVAKVRQKLQEEKEQEEEKKRRRKSRQ